MKTDPEWIAEAVAEARKGWGTTHPNPVVGAIVVEDGQAVARGHHVRAGEAHAERIALASLGRPPRPGATLYITLEPCSSHGRTPPCVDAILATGIRRVVIGATDPDPRHRGRGCAILREAGVEVVEGVCADLCADLNLIFNHRMETGRVLVAAKVATTLDGRIATRSGESKWITGPDARADVMRWRRYFPAIGVGAGTVVADDPQLSSRGTDGDRDREWFPCRFVFDRGLRLGAGFKMYQIFGYNLNLQTVVVSSSQAAAERGRELSAADGVDLWPIADGPTRGWWPVFLERLAEAGLGGILVEGGAGLLGDLFAGDCVDYLFHYRAPIAFLDPRAPGFADAGTLERLTNAWSLRGVRREVLGRDDLIRGWVERGDSFGVAQGGVAGK